MPGVRREDPNSERAQKPNSKYDGERRKILAQARQEELKLAQLEGTLISKDAVQKEVYRMTREVRDGLQNVGARIGGQVAAESDSARCTAIINKEIQQCLEGLTCEPPSTSPASDSAD